MLLCDSTLVRHNYIAIFPLKTFSISFSFKNLPNHNFVYWIHIYCSWVCEKPNMDFVALECSVTLKYLNLHESAPKFFFALI